MMRRALLTVYIVSAAASGCGRPDDAQGADAHREAHPSASVKWVPVRSAKDASPEEYPARILTTSGATAVSVPPLPARILTLSVKPGDTIAKDAPIARVVMPEADAASATIASSETSLAILTKRRAKLGLLEAEGLAKGSDLAALDLEVARLEGERRRASAVLVSAGLSGGGVVVLRSPIAGVVTEVSAIQGELRRPEDGPLARIRNRSGQRIEALVPSPLSPESVYTFRSGSDLPVAVTFVASVPKAAGTGYQAWFDAAENVTLPAGTEGRVLVRGKPVADARLVPASAVGTRGLDRFVVVRTRTQDTESIVVVDVLRIASSDAVVRGALPEGALVAADPYRTERGRRSQPGADGEKHQ